MSETRTMDEQFDKDVFSAGLDAPADDDDVVAQGLTSNKAADQTPGQMLREARLAQDCSLADLCGLTMLPKRTVEALEDDDFEALAQPVFVRGYYRKCAKILEIDPEPLLAAYAAVGGASVVATTPQQPPRSVGAPVKVVPVDVTPGNRRSFSFVLLILILVVAVIAGYTYWSGSLNRIIGNDAGSSDISLSSALDGLQPESASESDAQTTTDATGQDNNTEILPDILAADEKADAAAGRDNATQAATTGATAGDGTAVAAGGTGDVQTAMTPEAGPTGSADSTTAAMTTGAAGAGATGETVADAQSPTTNAGAGETGTAGAATTALTIKFDDRSWVNIHDASGKQLLVGIYENTTRTLDGEPPYRLVIGYGPGVSVSYGGHPVEFDMAGNHTARFTVGAGNG